jgi:hypothetical protein
MIDVIVESSPVPWSLCPPGYDQHQFAVTLFIMFFIERMLHPKTAANAVEGMCYKVPSEKSCASSPSIQLHTAFSSAQSLPRNLF